MNLVPGAHWYYTLHAKNRGYYRSTPIKFNATAMECPKAPQYAPELHVRLEDEHDASADAGASLEVRWRQATHWETGYEALLRYPNVRYKIYLAPVGNAT